MSRAYTPAEEAWLRERYPTLHPAELMAEHDGLFPDSPRTYKALLTRAKRLGVRKAEGYQRNPPRMWPPEKVAWFCAFVPGHSESEISAEHERMFGTPLSEAQIGNAKAKLGVRSGTHGGRFEKGHTPHNKGKTWADYGAPEGHARSRETCFRAGNLSGYAAQHEQPVGAERVNRDGYVEVKVAEDPQAKPNKNFRMKHHVVYEQAHGPIPDGCNIVFADRDRRNFDPANLVAVPRKLWSTIAKRKLAYHDADSLRAAMAVAELDQAAHAARCAPRACRRCGAEFEPRYPHQRTCDACLAARLES